MGFFDKILGNKGETTPKKTNVQWNQLTSIAQIEDALIASNTKKVVIFKHSTRCSISATVLSKFEKQIGADHELYILDLIAYRDISNAIAEKFNIVHQSPQAIFIEKGKVYQHDSHYAILELNY